jgi:hypothetical protein
MANQDDRDIVPTNSFCQDNCIFVKLIINPDDLSDSDIKMASLNHCTLLENNRSAGLSQKSGKERVVYANPTSWGLYLTSLNVNGWKDLGTKY